MAKCCPHSKSVRTESKNLTGEKFGNIPKQNLDLNNNPTSNVLRQIRSMKFETMANSNWPHASQAAMHKSVKN